MKSERLLLLILAAVQFTHIIDFMIIMPLGPQFMRVFDITPRQFSVIVSAYAFCAFIASLMSAMFIDRFDRRKALLVLYIGFILGTLACAWARWPVPGRRAIGFFWLAGGLRVPLVARWGRLYWPLWVMRCPSNAGAKR